ncbi:hypothetical protein EDD17DRAFT_997140 [Pisolithus thermaeus]|nr:hypothetical protein EDD17DRAFT_997140 [Pisolithus thermaeus]
MKWCLVAANGWNGFAFARLTPLSSLCSTCRCNSAQRKFTTGQWVLAFRLHRLTLPLLHIERIVMKRDVFCHHKLIGKVVRGG